MIIDELDNLVDLTILLNRYYQFEFSNLIKISARMSIVL